ncbi:MAG: tellurite resistance TerB family protein [Rubrivivax sp.]|nr:tellurite resistance TerB family protein [Rubrivivax sp.]
MNIQSLLDQILKAGGANDPARRADMGKYATGAAVGGVLGLLLGTSSGRRMGGKVLKYGSVAAIGALAWKAYQEHQASQAARAAPTPAGGPGGVQPTVFEALPAPQQETHSQAILTAMIAAAKADGHLDERERGLLQAELQRVQADAATQQWAVQAVERPASAADVAALAQGPEMAAEIYLASVLVVDESNPAERSYLDDLAQRLRLAPSLKADLEAKAKLG